MKLQELLSKYTFDHIFEEIQLMAEDADKWRDVYRHAYEIMLDLQVIPSKKVIRYCLMDDPDSDDCFAGAPDSCFSTTWEVVLAKDILVDSECELSELELTVNAFLCTIYIGRCPRAFLPEKRLLIGEE